VTKVKKHWEACRDCGSTDIQISVWTYINKEPHEEGFFAGGDCHIDSLVCDGCYEEGNDGSDAQIVTILEHEDGSFSKPEKNRFTYYPTIKEAWLA